MSKQCHPPTPEQMEIVRWGASLGAITAEALALRLATTHASARARLAAIERRGMLARTRPLAASPALFSVTRVGLRACGARGIDPCRIAPASARHLMVCASAAAVLERCYVDHRLMGERELRRDERELGRPLASARLGSRYGGEHSLHRPDLVLWPSARSGLPVAVEVELTVKAPRRLLEICRAWARCRGVAGVLYIAPPGVRRALERAIAEARAWEQIAVVEPDALPGMESLPKV